MSDAFKTVQPYTTGDIDSLVEDAFQEVVLQSNASRIESTEAVGFIVRKKKEKKPKKKNKKKESLPTDGQPIIELIADTAADGIDGGDSLHVVKEPVSKTVSSKAICQLLRKSPANTFRYLQISDSTKDSNEEPSPPPPPPSVPINPISLVDHERPTTSQTMSKLDMEAEQFAKKMAQIMSPRVDAEAAAAIIFTKITSYQEQICKLIDSI